MLGWVSWRCTSLNRPSPEIQTINLPEKIQNHIKSGRQANIFILELSLFHLLHPLSAGWNSLRWLELKELCRLMTQRPLRLKGSGFQMTFPSCPYNPGLIAFVNIRQKYTWILLKPYYLKFFFGGGVLFCCFFFWVNLILIHTEHLKLVGGGRN